MSCIEQMSMSPPGRRLQSLLSMQPSPVDCTLSLLGLCPPELMLCSGYLQEQRHCSLLLPLYRHLRSQPFSWTQCVPGSADGSGARLNILTCCLMGVADLTSNGSQALI